MASYTGSCHCGAVRFSFTGEEITEGLSCNCSYCVRRQALMLPYTLSVDALSREVEEGMLGLYQFGAHRAKHYFCKRCGIYTFHESSRQPGFMRVNLGCVNGIDSYALPRKVFNGRELL